MMGAPMFPEPKSTLILIAGVIVWILGWRRLR